VFANTALPTAKYCCLSS